MLKPRKVFSHPPSAICPFPISPSLIPPSRNPPSRLLGQFEFLNIKNSSAFRKYDRTTGRQDDRKEYDRTKDRQRTLGKYMINMNSQPIPSEFSYKLSFFYQCKLWFILQAVCWAWPPSSLCPTPAAGTSPFPFSLWNYLLLLGMFEDLPIKMYYFLISRTASKIPWYVFLFWELRGLSPNFHIFMCLWAIYIFPGSVHIFPAP